MGNYRIELMRDGKAVKRAEIQGSEAEAAKTFGPVTDGLGREPQAGEFVRVTHLASGRTSWFRISL